MFGPLYTSKVRDFVDPRHPVDLLRAREVRKSIDFSALDRSATENSDTVIGEVLRAGKPALIGRLGATEARFIGECIKISHSSRFLISRDAAKYLHPRWKPRLRDIHKAGFFPQTWEEIDLFTNQYHDALESTDVLGAWRTAFAWPERIALQSMKPRKVVRLEHTAPWVVPRNRVALPEGTESSLSHPWSQMLDGKRVLVVSHFVDTIHSQFKIRHKIFPGYKYPEFDLRLVRSPWLMTRLDAENHDWIWHLDNLKNEIASEPFDIALIAAGAYAYPLAHHVKQIGKIGIHAGGALQLFFGILGRRWEVRPSVKSFVNEFWTRPRVSETPLHSLEIDDGCYW